MCTDANSKGMVMAQNSSYNNAAIGLLLVACNGTLWYGGKVKILAVDYNVTNIGHIYIIGYFIQHQKYTAV